jgi:hypothetical protein
MKCRPLDISYLPVKRNAKSPEPTHCTCMFSARNVQYKQYNGGLSPLLRQGYKRYRGSKNYVHYIWSSLNTQIRIHQQCNADPGRLLV